MTIYRLDVPQPEYSAHRGRLVALGSTIAALFVRLSNAIRNRRSVKQLIEWDDRMLNDVGLTRGDVVSAMSGSVADDPGLRLSFLANERRQAHHASGRERLKAYSGRRVLFERRNRNVIEL